MVFTLKKRQSNRRLLRQLDDFDQDVIIGNTASEKKENTIVKQRSGNRDFTVGTSGNKLMTNENTVKVKTLERCFIVRIDWKKNNIVDAAEERIQNANLIAIDSIATPKTGIAIRSTNASSGQDATSVSANSQRGERIGITAPFENASENNNVLHISNVNDETRKYILDEVSESLVQETRIDRQTHAHHVIVIFYNEEENSF